MVFNSGTSGIWAVLDWTKDKVFDIINTDPSFQQEEASRSETGKSGKTAELE